jgi:branched-chain amino acid transport system ATP-binding protein
MSQAPVPTEGAANEIKKPAVPDLTVTNLEVHYGHVPAVRGISFAVPGGASVGIIGANGAGKTSTMKAILGHVSRRADTLTFGDIDLTKIAARNVVRNGIGYVPEGRHVFGGLAVEKNLLLGAYARPWRSGPTEQLKEIYALFPVLGDMSARLAGALSGGQQQMLAIGRALMSNPQLLVLDEPSMGLGPKLVDEVLDVIQRLNQSGMSILLVEQNAKMTFGATNHCFVMENGEIVMDGPAEDLRLDPQVRRIYLGV